MEFAKNLPARVMVHSEDHRKKVQDIWRGFHFAILELLDMLPHHEVKELVIETCREPTVISHQYFITPLGDYCKLLQLL